MYPGFPGAGDDATFRSEVATTRERWLLTIAGGYVALKHIVSFMPAIVDDDEDDGKEIWRIRVSTVDRDGMYLDAIYESKDKAAAEIVSILSGKRD